LEFGSESRGQVDEASNTPLATLEGMMKEEETRSSETVTYCFSDTVFQLRVYAHSYWDVHTKGDAEDVPEIQHALFAFLELNPTKANRMIERRWAHFLSAIDPDSKIQCLNVLHILAVTGLERLCEVYLNHQIQGSTYLYDLSLRLIYQKNN
jgi:hypothetical protein